VYYSTNVPAMLAVDLQAHLSWVVDRLDQYVGLRAVRIPDIYLVGSRAVLAEVSEAVGLSLGFEDGFFKPSSPRSGIYMRTDSFRTQVQRTLTHEYVHLVLHEFSEDVELPAWPNEGMAKYLDLETGLAGERPRVARRYLYASADLARSAALAGELLPLPSLESQADWNAQEDENLIHLQYSEAHMAARFMVETFGTTSPVIVLREIAEGSTLEDALSKVTQLSYAEFQSGFLTWLKAWEDPARAKVQTYVKALNGIIASQDAIVERRNAVVRRADPVPNSATSYLAIVKDAEALRANLNALEVPAAASQPHVAAKAYLEKLVLWLTLERDYNLSNIDSKRVQANAMIAEIDARETLLNREIIDVEYEYQLQPAP
jgi:hypothetical protein